MFGRSTALLLLATACAPPAASTPPPITILEAPLPSNPKDTSVSALASNDGGASSTGRASRLDPGDRVRVDELVSLFVVVALPNSMARSDGEAGHTRDCVLFFEEALSLAAQLTPSLRAALLSSMAEGPDKSLEAAAAATVLGAAADEKGRRLHPDELARWKLAGFSDPNADIIGSAFERGAKARMDGVASVCGE